MIAGFNRGYRGYPGWATLLQYETLVEASSTPSERAALGSRDSFVGVDGPYVALKIGKSDTPYKRSTALFDPFRNTVGVLVHANHGRRERLTVAGAPVGERIDVPAPGAGGGSIIVVVATDAPLLPHQCDRISQRSALGIARVGGAGENSSGDIALAFSTGNPHPDRGPVEFVPNDEIDPLFYATIEATEEAIVNAMINAETMTGRDGITAHKLDHDRLLDIMARYGRGPRAATTGRTPQG